MIQRCTNDKAPDYARYGGRGVTVWSRWTDFAAFLADMGVRPDGKTLDRHPNPDGNYEPGNCRWATPKEQAHNGRTTKVSDVGVCIMRHMRRRGESLPDLAHAFGVTKSTVHGIVAGGRRAP